MFLSKIKQCFCKHNFELIGQNKHISENLYKCKKCNAYRTYHRGIGIYTKIKYIKEEDWIFTEEYRNEIGLECGKIKTDEEQATKPQITKADIGLPYQLGNTRDEIK